MNNSVDGIEGNAIAIGLASPRFEQFSVEELESRVGPIARYVYWSGIEAYARDEIRRALSVVMRILEPAGILRVATPDLDAIVYGYLLEWGAKELPNMTRAQRLNDWRKNANAQFVFNEEDLRAELEMAGFVDMWRLAAGASSIEAFMDCEQDSTALVLEGRKPSLL